MPATKRDSLKPTPVSSWQWSLVAAAVVFGCLFFTSGMLPMVWDEGNAILRAHDIITWMQQVAVGDVSMFDRQAIERHWRFTTQIEGHPAFYATVIAAGLWFGQWLPDPLTAARLGPMALFAVASGCVFYRVWHDHGRLAAVGTIASLLVLPRLFAHAHFASFDGPLTACWMIAWAWFLPARGSTYRTVLWGVVLGMLFSCKATGWTAPAAMLVWTLLYRDRAALKTLVIGVPIALVTFYLLNPTLWHHPWDGFQTFLRLNGQRNINVPTQFFGQIYDLHHPLPWYNTLVWTAVTIPIGVLGWLAVGVYSVGRGWQSQQAGVLVLLSGLVLIVIRALPIAPPHDGVRLFLPCFPMLAVLAGIGLDRSFDWITRHGKLLWAWIAAAAIWAGSLSSLVWYAPHWLSYYNLLLGGVAGAEKLGMEPTYYWDGLDRQLLNWLADHTGDQEKVRFDATSGETLVVLKVWNRLHFAYGHDAPGDYRWYVMQNRPSMWDRRDRWLIEHRQTAYRKQLGSGGWGPWRRDVVLIRVYAEADYLAADQFVSGKRNP